VYLGPKVLGLLDKIKGYLFKLKWVVNKVKTNPFDENELAQKLFDVKIQLENLLQFRIEFMKSKIVYPRCNNYLLRQL
jgi:hypothetical protein